MMVVGTTSFEVTDLDYVPVVDDQVTLMLERGAGSLVPDIRKTKIRGKYMATRPLMVAGIAGRSIARRFKNVRSQKSDNIEEFVTITGGKATTLRGMAEKTADMVCTKMRRTGHL